MISYEGTVMLARVAVPVAGGIGVAMSLAILGAMAEAFYPGWGTRVWAGVRLGLSVAYRAFCLVGLLVLAVPFLLEYAFRSGKGLVKAYLARVYRARWEVRTTGRHRYSRVLAWSEGIRTAKGLVNA